MPKFIPVILALCGLSLLTLAASVLAEVIPAAGEPDHYAGRLSVGYRGVDQGGATGRVYEYGVLESGPTAAGSVSSFRQHRHFYFDFDYQDQDEYQVNAYFDHHGLLRLSLFGSGLVHNLEHLPYAADVRPKATAPPLAGVLFTDSNPGDRYQYRIGQQEARFRGKYPGLPAHLNLEYWRFERKGERQLRFLDESCTGCHLQSRSQPVERVTEEVKVSLDSHLGPLDLILEQVVRQFDAKGASTFDEFGEHKLRDATSLEHDATPDSRMTASTVKIHTSLAGGVVAAASHTWGRRENRADLSGLQPVDADTRFRKSAGDLTIAPSEKWTLHLRYRLLDLDQDNSDTMTVEALTTYGGDARGEFDVRPSIDLTRAVYQGTICYRPRGNLALKGEFRREELHRSETGGPEPSDALVDPIIVDMVWELPEDEVINTCRISFSSRLGRKHQTRINGWYEYRDSSDPAYGTASDRRHVTFAGLVWRPSAKWGSSANLRYETGENERHRLEFVDSGDFDLDHSSTKAGLSAGVWSQPSASLNLALHYGWLRSDIRQDLLFGHDSDNGWAIEDENVDYRQQVQSLIGTASWRLRERLTLSGAIGYILSKARYSPDFPARSLDFDDGIADNPLPVDPGGLRTLSAVDIRQWRVGFGGDWSMAGSWVCSARITLDDYNDRNDDYFDGRVETCSLSLTKSW